MFSETPITCLSIPLLTLLGEGQHQPASDREKRQGSKYQHVLAGGVRSRENEVLRANALRVNHLNLGIPDAFVEHGIYSGQLASIELDPKGLYSAILNHINHGSSVINPDKKTLCAPLPSSQL
jgi:hypothetical protein